MADIFKTVPDTHAFSINIRLEVIMGLSFVTVTFDLR